MFAYSDLNECTEGIDDCADYGICINTIGSYECICNNGYSGDGRECNGKYVQKEKQAHKFFITFTQISMNVLKENISVPTTHSVLTKMVATDVCVMLDSRHGGTLV